MTEQEQAVVFVSIILAMVTFAMGLGLVVEDFRRVAKHPRAVAVGLVGQVLFLPLLGFAVAAAFGLVPALAVGVVLLTACPGGAHSNLYAYFAKGDVALSISLTAVSNVIAMVTLPAIVYGATALFDREGVLTTVSPFEAVMQLVVVIGIPLSVGMMVRSRSPKWAARLEKVAKWVAVVLLVLLIVLSVAKNREQMLDYLVRAGAPVLTLNLLAMGAAFVAARLAHLAPAQTATITLEVGIQNGTLAVGLAKTLTGDWSVAAPGIVYSLVIYFTGLLVVAYGRRQAALGAA